MKLHTSARRTLVSWLAVSLAAVLVSACGGGSGTSIDREDGGSCSAELTGWVAASSWLQDASDIAGYRYRTSPGEPVIQFELYDADGNELGDMRVQQIAEQGDGPTGAMKATFSGVGSNNVEMTTVGRERGLEYSVQSTLTRGNQTFYIWADFGAARCPVDKQSSGPPCSGRLSVGQSPYLLPSCGLFLEDRLLSGLQPRLRHLQFGVPADSTSSPPEDSGFFQNKFAEARTRTVVSEGEPTQASAVDSWLSNAGASEFATSTATRRLALAYLDQPWRGEVRTRRRECQEGGANGTSSSGQSIECRRSGLTPNSDLETRRQAQSGCGDGGFDQGGYGGSGDDFGSGGGGNCSGGCANGDPHLTTFDGHGYDFQGAGEFTLVESTGDERFEIQGRFEPRSSNIDACGNVTWVTAVAATLGQKTVSIYGDRQPRLYVDGNPVDDPADVSDWPDGSVIRMPEPGEYRLRWPNGTELEVSIENETMDLDVDLADAWRGDVRGLLGTFNGTQADDFQTASGRRISQPPSFEQLYDSFGASWRINTTDSLFTYESGNDASTYNMPNFPDGPVALSDLPTQEREDALQTCRDRDVAPGAPLRWCVLDTVCASDSGDSPAERMEDVSEPDGLSADDLTTTGDVRQQAEQPDVSVTETQPPATTCGASKPGISVLREQQDISVSGDLQVDATPETTIEKSSDLQETTISPGDPVTSYLLHLRPVDGGAMLQGSVRVPNEVLGVALQGSSLQSTDGTVGLSDASYPSGAQNRGVDLDQGDRIAVTSEEVQVELNASQNIDHVRIFVRGESQ